MFSGVSGLPACHVRVMSCGSEKICSHRACILQGNRQRGPKNSLCSLIHGGPQPSALHTTFPCGSSALPAESLQPCGFAILVAGPASPSLGGSNATAEGFCSKEGSLSPPPPLSLTIFGYGGEWDCLLLMGRCPRYGVCSWPCLGQSLPKPAIAGAGHTF